MSRIERQDVQDLLADAAFDRPSRIMAERRLFAAVAPALDWPLPLSDDPGDRDRIAGSDASLVRDLALMHIEDELLERIDYSSFAGAVALLARLFDPNRTTNIEAAILSELDEAMEEAA